MSGLSEVNGQNQLVSYAKQVRTRRLWRDSSKKKQAYVPFCVMDGSPNIQYEEKKLSKSRGLFRRVYREIQQ